MDTVPIDSIDKLNIACFRKGVLETTFIPRGFPEEILASLIHILCIYFNIIILIVFSQIHFFTLTNDSSLFKGCQLSRTVFPFGNAPRFH